MGQPEYMLRTLRKGLELLGVFDTAAGDLTLTELTT